MSLITLADGRQYDVVAKKVVGESETSEHIAPTISLSPKPKKDLRLNDLPATPRQANVFAAAIVYEMLNFPDVDLKYALSCNQEQLDALRASEGYTRIKMLVHEAILHGLNEDARSIIAKNSSTAAETVAGLMIKSKSEAIRLKAAETLLNRAGINNDEMAINDGNSLVIKVVKGDTPVNVSITANG